LFLTCAILRVAHPNAIILAVAGKKACLGMLEPRCSTWIWLCTSMTKRTVGNPRGNTNELTVHESNRIACRSTARFYYSFKLRGQQLVKHKGENQHKYCGKACATQPQRQTQII
jgi:hypothetical protein